MTDCLVNLPLALASVAPDANAGVWTDALLAPMRSDGLVTPRRAAAFLGQVAEETGGFTVLAEDLRYSAPALLREWPSHFAPTPLMPDATDYAYQPEKIANWVYANRMGNGAPATGDGWAFRGAGLIQITGRQNYTQFAAAVGRSLDGLADWMQTPQGAAVSACWCWNQFHLNALADAWEITEITRRINGGETNLDRRITLCNAALAAFGAAPSMPSDATMAAANSDDAATDALNDAEAKQVGVPTMDS